MTETNFWSQDININAESSPKVLMKKQASELGRITRNLVEAEVTTVIFDENQYQHCFTLVAPILNYEKITLFCINQPLVADFPLKISYDFSNKHTETNCDCNDLTSFEHCLRDILSSKEVGDLINSLIAQSSSD
jgi:hypothetical protein